MSLVYKAGAIVLAASLSSFAFAQPPSPQEQAERSTELRQSVFKLIASNYGPLRAMGRGDIPVDLALAEKSATRVSQLSLMITDYFQRDTRGFELDTESLPVIWENPDGFAQKAQNLTEAADLVVAAAQSGDLDATKEAAASVGQNCGSCHDDFRED